MRMNKLPRRFLSILLLVAILTASMPVIAVAEDAVGYDIEQADLLTKGDLSLKELANKVLPDNERPEIISKDIIAEHKNVHRLYEQEEDLNSIVFQNSDGTKTLYYFEDAVKYIDADGTVKDKSNTLYSGILDKAYGKDYSLVNADNDIKTYFPNVLSDTSGVVLTADNVKIEMYPLSASETMYADTLAGKIVDKLPIAEQREDNFVYYNESFGKGSAIRYTPLFTGVKEDIILESDIGVYDFSFLVSAQGLRAVQDGSSVLFYDEAGSQVADFAEIVIFDSAAEQNTSFLSTVSIEGTENPDEFIYTIHVDREFLQSKETVYPVYIDPTITINVSGSGTTKTIIDTPIYSGVPTNCQGANIYNVIGYASNAGAGYGVGRTLMKFPGLMSNATFQSISASQVTSLKLYLHELSGKSTSTTIYANLYTGAAWNETTTAYNNVTWSGYGTQLNSQTFTATNAAWIAFDLTSAVSTWKANSTTADKGIMLRNSNETADANRRDFRSTENSSNKPYLTLDYVATVLPTSVTVPNTSVNVNATTTLTATVLPSNTTNKSVTWSSGNTSIATVNSTSGVVTGVNPGTVTITATSQAVSTVKGTCTVTVNPTTYTAMSLNSTYSGTISAGRHFWYTFTPSKTGTYVFESTGSMDTYGILYQGSSQINYNDDGGAGSNFKITHRLVSGTQYRLMVRGYSTSTTGSFSVGVKEGWPEATKPTINPRSDWGARALDTSKRVARTRDPQRIIFHHSAEKFSSTDLTATKNEIKRLQNYHMDSEGKSDIAYHFIIDPAGRIWVGAELDGYQRGHATGYFDDIGVLILGDFESRWENIWSPNTLNQNQKNAMETLSKWLCYSNNLSIVASGQNVAPISTHKTVYSGTVCPGENAAPWIEGDLRTTINNWRS